MAKNGKSFGNSIGGGGGASEIKSGSIVEADGRFDRTRADPNKGAGSVVGEGAWGRIPVPSLDPKVRGAGPSPASPPQRRR